MKKLLNKELKKIGFNDALYLLKDNSFLLLKPSEEEIITEKENLKK